VVDDLADRSVFRHFAGRVGELVLVSAMNWETVLAFSLRNDLSGASVPVRWHW
jgi:hypothetical protein